MFRQPAAGKDACKLAPLSLLCVEESMREIVRNKRKYAYLSKMNEDKQLGVYKCYQKNE